jgi:predicted Zn finger-like uncharacterized protein
MIITCPSCATRYDVDDDRFSPDGRSVRCAECNESWFVPAPQPIENLMPLKPKGRKAEAGDEPRGDGRKSSLRRDDAYEEGVDEPLFDAPSKSARFRIDAEVEDDRGHKAKDERSPRRAEARDAEEPEQRNFRSSRREADEEKSSARAERDTRRGEEDAREADLRAVRERRESKVVDADFEDLGRQTPEYQDQVLGRGFGRKMRDRETALARLEDLEPIAERVFNDEFFTALRVQPKELERAIRKARRRAEAREKNRLTPWRALGWSAWIGVIAACGFVGYSYRNNIVAMFPNAKGAYDAVGIEANPYGLKIEGVTHRVAMSPEGPVIEILGRLRNEERGDVAPPMLQAEALGADGEVLSRWTFAARADKVRAGESADFSTRAPAPDGVSEVVLAFVPAEGVKVSIGGLLKTADQ